MMSYSGRQFANLSPGAGPSVMTDAGRVDTLALADCYAYDARPGKSGGYLRFHCPLHGGDRQQSLSVEEATGKFRCHNGACGAWGTVTEHQKVLSPGAGSQTGWSATRRMPFKASSPALPPLPEAKPIDHNEGAVKRAEAASSAFMGSLAESYAASRGIPQELAIEHNLGYWRGRWGGIDSEWLTFPLRCPVTGHVVSVGGRNLHSNEQDKKSRVFGEKGIFGATEPGPLPPDVLWVEGPFEVFACLVSKNLPPCRAVWGTGGRAEWFDGCQRVTIFQDDDEAGAKATTRLAKDLNHRRERRGKGPQILCIAPGALRDRYEVKDLGELLQRGITVPLSLPPLLPDSADYNAVAWSPASVVEEQEFSALAYSLRDYESLVLDAQLGRLPTCSPALTLPSNRKVSDANNAVRGLLASWKHAQEKDAAQIAFIDSQTNAPVTWGMIAQRDADDLDALTRWYGKEGIVW